MWLFIETAYEKFSAADKKRVEAEVGPLGKNPQFTGFDGNYETEYMGIAGFLVEKMDRFEHFKGRDFNSHVPVVDRSKQMIVLFGPMRSSLVGRELTADQVITLMKRA
jgi:uncharacterized protein